MTTDRNKMGCTPNFAPSWESFWFQTYFLNRFIICQFSFCNLFPH